MLRTEPRVGRLPLLALALPLATIFLPSGTGQAAGRAARPNIVVLLADDLGYADVGFQGCKDIPTPHLDALAKGGVVCTNGYVTCPVCAPTRAGLLTGRYQQRLGFEDNSWSPKTGLSPEATTVADVLKAAGYSTFAVGKWHLGQLPQFRPLVRGFTDHYGFLGGGRSFRRTSRSQRTSRPPTPKSSAGSRLCTPTGTVSFHPCAPTRGVKAVPDLPVEPARGLKDNEKVRSSQRPFLRRAGVDGCLGA